MARILDFYADWCGPCKQQTPILEELDDAYGGVELEKINVDEQQVVANEYGVRSLPTIIIEDDEGNPVERFVGLTQRADLEEALNGVA